MKTIKKITSLTAAAAMLLSAADLPADAAFVYSSYIEVENGAVVVHRDYDIFGFIAVTDGTELETFKNGRYDPIEAVVEITMDDASIPEWESSAYASSAPVNSSLSINWSESAAALFASYGEDARYYKVELDDASSKYKDRFSEISRHFMLENEGVLDVIAYSYHIDALAEWKGTFTVAYDGKTPEAIREEIKAELNPILLEAHDNYVAWQQMISDWQTETDTSGMTGAEIAASRAAAGIPSEYEIADYAYGVAKQISEIRTEYLVTSEPDFRLLSGTMVYTGTSIWNGVGDVDGNGEIDASDSAAILSESALSGIGNNGTFTSEQTAAADVNADGQVDSSDAAFILVYSAQKGTGTGVSLADVVMNRNPEPPAPPQTAPELLGWQSTYLGWDEFYPFDVPVVITSLQELKDFYSANFYPYSSEDWNDIYSPDSFSHNFKYVGAKYDDAYFAEHDLVLLFCQAPVAEDCFEVTDITADAQNRWTIHVTEFPSGATPQTSTWCLFAETNKGAEAANGISASITKYQDSAKTGE